MYLLQKKLRALYQNRYTAPQLRHAVVETDLRLEELCALNLAWEIDGDQLVYDWSAEDSYGRLAALTDIFGERYVCFYFMYPYNFCLFIYSIFWHCFYLVSSYLPFSNPQVRMGLLLSL